MPRTTLIPRASPALGSCRLLPQKNGNEFKDCALITQPVQREFVSVKCQSCRGTSLSQVLSTSESVKEGHAAGYKCSSVYIFHFQILSALSPADLSVTFEGEMTALHSAPKMLLERQQIPPLVLAEEGIIS